MPKEIKAFVTKDGKIFTEINEAIHHEHIHQINTDLENFIDEKCWRGMEQGDVKKFLVDNAKELIDLLKPFDVY